MTDDEHKEEEKLHNSDGKLQNSSDDQDDDAYRYEVLWQELIREEGDAYDENSFSIE